MGTFRVTFNEQVTIIANEVNDFVMKVEKDRQLTDHDTGAIIEATPYQELSTFVPVCNYVFEAVDHNQQSVIKNVDTDAFYEAIEFFFQSILNTAYFIKSVPKCSALYATPASVYECVNDIQVSNLYELLSGY